MIGGLEVVVWSALMLLLRRRVRQTLTLFISPTGLPLATPRPREILPIA